MGLRIKGPRILGFGGSLNPKHYLVFRTSSPKALRPNAWNRSKVPFLRRTFAQQGGHGNLVTKGAFFLVNHLPRIKPPPLMFPAQECMMLKDETCSRRWLPMQNRMYIYIYIYLFIYLYIYIYVDVCISMPTLCAYKC